MFNTIKFSYRCILLLMLTAGLSCLISCGYDFQHMFMNDLQFIKETLEHHHPGTLDTHNPKFCRWLNKGFIQACAMARSVNSKAAYVKALQRYLNGFKDGHVGLSYNTDDIKQWYNDFSFYYDGTCYRVAASPDTSIPVNTHVLTINGMPTQEFVQKNLLAFQGNADLASSFYKAAFRLSYWQENPFAQRPELVEFDLEGNHMSHTLIWHESTKLPSGADPEKSFVCEEILPNTIWIRLATFMPSDNERSSLEAVVASLSGYHDHDIIFDVRGNGGGNSLWSRLIIDQLCGKDWHKQHVMEHQVDWRISQENIDYLNNLIPHVLQQFGNDRSLMHYIERIKIGLETALTLGQVYYQELPDNTSRVDLNHTPSLHTGNVFVIIDEWCASACLDFIDDLKQCIKKLYLIGHPTSADSLYMEIRDIALPSGTARMFFPLKVFRDRLRGNNEPYTPDVPWTGRMNEMQKLQTYFIDNKDAIVASKSS